MKWKHKYVRTSDGGTDTSPVNPKSATMPRSATKMHKINYDFIRIIAMAAHLQWCAEYAACSIKMTPMVVTILLSMDDLKRYNEEEWLAVRQLVVLANERRGMSEWMNNDVGGGKQQSMMMAGGGKKIIFSFFLALRYATRLIITRRR